MNHNEAIKTIREALNLIIVKEWRDKAIDALDQLEAESKPQEPSEDARAWALDTARWLWIETCKGGCSPTISSEVWAMRLSALITAREERIRRECADRAWEYLEKLRPHAVFCREDITAAIMGE